MSTGPFSVLRWGCLLHGRAELGWGGGEVKAEERRDGCPAFLTGPEGARFSVPVPVPDALTSEPAGSSGWK